jgi:hypothetical protein
VRILDPGRRSWLRDSLPSARIGVFTYLCATCVRVVERSAAR